MTAFFRGKDEAAYQRLLHMKACVEEQVLYGEPCPLLLSQLNELEVFGEKMVSLARQLRTSIEGYHK